MKKTEKDLLIQEINKNAPKGHEVTKLITQSHSNAVTRVECNCGNYHAINNNSKVNWAINLQTDKSNDYRKDNNSFGIHGVNYNNF